MKTKTLFSLLTAVAANHVHALEVQPVHTKERGLFWYT